MPCCVRTWKLTSEATIHSSMAMRVGCAAGLLLLIAPSQAAQVDEWLQQMEHPRYPIFALRPENALDRYVSHDFWSLLIPRI